MTKTRKIVLIGMFSAIAYIFTLIGKLVPLLATDFLRYDPKDAIIVIAGFAMGAVPALVISVIVSFLEMITISTTGVIGFVMNVISSATFACISSLIYKKIRSVKGACLGLGVSSVCTVVAMLLWNYFITPLYMGAPQEVVTSMLLPVFLPFNAIKCGLNFALTMMLYKPCVSAMRGMGLLPRNTSKASRINPFVIVLSYIAFVAMCVAFILFFRINIVDKIINLCYDIFN